MFTPRPTGNRASDRAPAPVASGDAALERAIAEGRIDLRFQPQVDPRNGQVVGAEALARWSACGSAEILFGRARAARLAERLSRFIQRNAIRSAAEWGGSLATIRLSLNVLPEDLARLGYDQWLLAELDEAGLAPSRLTVEIVESALMVDRADVRDRLARLRDAGIEIAVDDFGTGYSSLAYLTSLPLDAIKIDRGLIADLVGGERDRIVVRAMIGMARELGLKVIVEGVETPAQLALLADWGCDLYQGFLRAAPLDQADLARFVAAANAPLAA